MNPLLRTLTALIISLGLTGCGGTAGPELSTVTGKITLDGTPYPGVVVTFIPEAGGSPSYGKTDADGNYELMFTMDKAGAMLGKHKVELEVRRISKEEADELRAGGEDVPDLRPLPKEYAKPDALTAEVKEGRNEIPFELKSM